VPAGAVAELLPERRQDLRSGVEQDDPRLGRVDVAEVAAQGAVRELGDLARPSPRRWAGADDDEGEQRSRSAWSVASSASSKAPKMRPRSSRASSMLFMPGANSANRSLPK
jgi:hypothetical protein